MFVTGVNPRSERTAAVVLPDWLDAKADVVRAWVPGQVLSCQVCQTPDWVWGEFRRADADAPRVAVESFCFRHLPTDWYTGRDGPARFDERVVGGRLEGPSATIDDVTRF
ncbi:MAG: hypothetical protein ACP5QO_03805 [Clostridia bacterium]